jgi:hypothetical protein
VGGRETERGELPTALPTSLKGCRVFIAIATQKLVDQSNRPCDLNNSHSHSQDLFGSIRTAAACARTGNEVK